MKKILSIFIFIFFALSSKEQTYNPSLHTVTNKAIGFAQATPDDGRSMFYDQTNFVYRDYASTSEVLTYLNLSKYRQGAFPIFIHLGGSLSGGSWTGGIRQVWWFRNGVADSNLVRWYTDSTSGGGGITQLNGDVQAGPGSGNVSATLAIVNSNTGLFGNAANVTQINFDGKGRALSVANVPIQISESQVTNLTTDLANKLSNITGLITTGAGYTLSGSGTIGSPYSLNISFPSFNQDSIKHFFVDTGAVARNLYAISWDSINRKWILAAPGSGGGGSGTVTNFVFTNGNGFNGTVTTSTTTPTLSLAPSFTGLTFSNGSAFAAATVSSPLTYSAGTLGIQVANTSQNGYLSSTDWNTFNGKINLTSLSATSPVLYNNATGVISEQVANTSQNGYLTSTDWNTFNGKQGAITLTTTGTSGAATFVSNTLNIPQYQGLLSNSGTGFRWFVPGSSIRSFVCAGCTLDSTSNAGSLTLTVTAGGSGTVTSFSAGTLSPLFTTSVATATTTPALTFSLSNAAANSVFGNNTGSSAAPAYFVPTSTTLNGWFGSTIQSAISLTTTGTSGAASFAANTLNIPQYQGALTLTTTGTSGASTLIGNTLNIPQYSGGGGAPLAGLNTQVQTDGGQTFVHASNILPINDTFYILASGQSNMGFPSNTGPIGDTTTDSRVQIWNWFSSTWVTATPGISPFTADGFTHSGNIAWYAAKQIAAKTNKHVRIVLHYKPSTSITGWWNGASKGPQMDSLTGKAVASGVASFNLFIWDQGEQDNALQMNTYVADYDSIKAYLRRQPYFQPMTPIIVCGMPKVSEGSTTDFSYSDRTLRTVDGNLDQWDDYANTDSATVQTGQIHFDNPGQKVIGLNAFATYQRMPVILPTSRVSMPYLKMFNTDSSGVASEPQQIVLQNQNAFGWNGLLVNDNTGTSIARLMINNPSSPANSGVFGTNEFSISGEHSVNKITLYTAFAKRATISSTGLDIFGGTTQTQTATGLFNNFDFIGQDNAHTWLIGGVGSTYNNPPTNQGSFTIYNLTNGPQWNISPVGLMRVGKNVQAGQSRLTIDGTVSANQNGTLGMVFSSVKGVVSDNNTVTGIIQHTAMHSLPADTLYFAAATGTDTARNASTLFIGGPPVPQLAHTVILKPWAIYDSLGNNYFGGSIFIRDTVDRGKSFQVKGTAYITDTLTLPNIADKSGDTTNFKPVVVDASGNIFKGNWAGGGGGGGTLTYTQNATNNNLAISGGNNVNFLPATSLLAGLLDTARAKYIDSARQRLITFTLNVANGLHAPTTDSIVLGGTFNQATTLATAGFAFSITGLPNKSIALSTDSSLIQDNTGKLFKYALSAAAYVPTSTGSANVTSTTADSATWMRVGNIVFVSGSVSVTPTTTTTTTSVTLTIPVNSSIINSHIVNGVANTQDNVVSGTGINGIVKFSSTANTVLLQFLSPTISGADILYYHYSYQVQ